MCEGLLFSLVLFETKKRGFSFLDWAFADDVLFRKD